MNIRTFLGPASGAIVAAGGVATPLGDLPAQLLLGLSGVSNIEGCLQFMKDQTSFGNYNPCTPLTDLSGLSTVANVIAFISIFLVVWAIVDLLKTLSR